MYNFFLVEAPVLIQNSINHIPERKIVKRVVQCKRETSSPSRKRIKKVDCWIDNKAKNVRAKGEEGIGRKGLIKAKKLKPGRSKCTDKISDQDRLLAFKEYYGLADKTKQWQCLGNWISLKKRREPDSEAIEIAKIYNKTLQNKSF